MAMIRMDALLGLLEPAEARGAVLQLGTGMVPALRRRNGVTPAPGWEAPLGAEQVRELLREVVAEQDWTVLQHTGYLRLLHRRGDTAYLLRIYRIYEEDEGGLWATLRVLGAMPPESWTLPPAVGMALPARGGGLVLCAGPPCAGKSTALCALLDLLEAGPPRQVVMLEQRAALPARGRRLLLVQREVGPEAVPEAIAVALRQGADVLVLDPFPVAAAPSALAAAEGGVLVLGTVESGSSAEAIALLGAALCPREPALGRQRLGRCLRVLLGLRLCPGREGQLHQACELILGGPGLSAAAAQGSGAALLAYIAAGRDRGMHSLDDSLASLVQAGEIAPGDAYLVAQNKHRFAPPF
ncbi:MAG: hypothetical protein RMK29_02500 [Myxococcales bacterium]|nr:hypothetical protein [Myxococcota bacterium]MDW8280551.1 hypothetical protein [Myxococcales bacterium]